MNKILGGIIAGTVLAILAIIILNSGQPFTEGGFPEENQASKADQGPAFEPIDYPVDTESVESQHFLEIIKPETEELMDT